MFIHPQIILSHQVGDQTTTQHPMVQFLCLQQSCRGPFSRLRFGLNFWSPFPPIPVVTVAWVSPRLLHWIFVWSAVKVRSTLIWHQPCLTGCLQNTWHHLQSKGTDIAPALHFLLDACLWMPAEDIFSLRNKWMKNRRRTWDQIILYITCRGICFLDTSLKKKSSFPCAIFPCVLLSSPYGRSLGRNDELSSA
jgi:hypothetical protein